MINPDAERTPPTGLGLVLTVADIRHCEAAWVDCDWFEAGHEVGGVFLLDPELMPLLSGDLEALLADEQRKRDQAGPRHEPGE